MSSLADANRQYFDAMAGTYDMKDWWAKSNQNVQTFLRGRLEWVGLSAEGVEEGKKIKMLDYACGTGLMTRIYAPYVSNVIGIDLAPAMVSEYNSRVAEAASSLSSHTSPPHAVVGDLFKKEDSNPEELEKFRDFDLATVGFGFHHFEDVTYAAKMLKERLRPSGWLLISDFLSGGDYKVDAGGKMIEESRGDHFAHHHHHHHGHGHGHGHGEHKHGHHAEHAQEEKKGAEEKQREKMNASIMVPAFTMEGVKNFFEEAGLVDVEIVELPEKMYMEVGGNKVFRTAILARGRRAAGEDNEKSEL